MGSLAGRKVERVVLSSLRAWDWSCRLCEGRISVLSARVPPPKLSSTRTPATLKARHHSAAFYLHLYLRSSNHPSTTDALAACRLLLRVAALHEHPPQPGFFPAAPPIDTPH